MISPPKSDPEPGPKSTRWSAASITSRSCSTRTSVLPRSRSRLQRVQEPRVVARVEADRRLVEDVQDARQAAANLAGQADPLALAAGKGGGPPGEAQVVEADIHEELEPVADLADEVAGDVLLVAIELQPFEKRQGPAERPVAHLVDREVAEPDGGRVVAEPRPHARHARDVVDHPLQLVPVHERDPARPPRSPGTALYTGTRTRADSCPMPGPRTRASPAPWRIDPSITAFEVVERDIEVDCQGLRHRPDHPGERRVDRRSFGQATTAP